MQLQSMQYGTEGPGRLQLPVQELGHTQLPAQQQQQPAVVVALPKLAAGQEQVAVMCR
jgi:hypothetical protein